MASVHLRAIGVIAAFALLAIGIGVYYLARSLPTPAAGNTADDPYVASVQLQGTVLPFLSNSTYLGPMNAPRSVLLEFVPVNNAPTSFGTNLTNWEVRVGLVAGVSECPVSEGVQDLGTTTVTWSSGGACYEDQSKVLTTIGHIETAFNIKINAYEYEGQVFYANPTDPYLPAEIVNYLVNIGGLNNYTSGCCS